MLNFPKPRLSLVLVLLVLSSVFVLPLVLQSSPLCPLSVSAQDSSPCLAQQATISAQQVELLQVQLTSSALQQHSIDLEATISALRAQSAPPVIVTVPVIITATPGSAAATPIPTSNAQADLTATPVDAHVEIAGLVSPGNLRLESVSIRNNGSEINLKGWTLSNSAGDVFTFPDMQLFSNGQITVYTQAGTNTPVALYWGQSEAVWSSGDVVSLKDPGGFVESSLHVS